MYQCDGCGYVYDESTAKAMPDRVIELAAAVAGRLTGAAPDRVARRPAADVWSVLEYASHLRDGMLVQRERVLLARWVECPWIFPMGAEERVALEGYADQDPGAVARQLTDAAALFANVLRRFDDEAWARTLIYNWPEKAVRSLAWVAVHEVHELVHHLADVERDLAT